jgi:hypothetical protein
MRKLYLSLLCLGLLLSDCKKNGVTTPFDTSYSTWQSFKKHSNSGYNFTAVRESFAWIHARTETKITVINGTIAERDYVAYSYQPKAGVDTLVKTVAEQWHEDKTTLNSHGESYWFLTMDEVYAKAKNEWLNVDPKTNEIYFETKNNGMLSTAGYVPKNCADDCFNGINISEITML